MKTALKIILFATSPVWGVIYIIHTICRDIWMAVSKGVDDLWEDKKDAS